jgi:hypothetical protein
MGQAYACERPCTSESEDTSHVLELQGLIEADIRAVEQLKRTKFPVLDWQNSQSVQVHTDLATLYNSRFVAPVEITRASNTRWYRVQGQKFRVAFSLLAACCLETRRTLARWSTLESSAFMTSVSAETEWRRTLVDEAAGPVAFWPPP